MLNIRRAREEDSELIWQVHSRAIKEICSEHYLPEEIEAWIEFRTPEGYKESLRSKEIFVAEENDVVIGFGTLNAKSNEIEAIYVSPDVARRGIGLRILRRLEERARELGIESLHLDATLNAVPFYESAGYEAQQEAKHRFPFGLEIVCMPMVRNLIH